MVKIKTHKDASGKTYYRTEDEQYLILRNGSYWEVMKQYNKVDRVHIWDGYVIVWGGLNLKDSKGYVLERYLQLNTKPNQKERTQ